MPQGFKSTRTLGVVFQIEGVDIEILEQSARNDVVRSLRKMPPTDEISSAQMDARVHVMWALGYRVVVEIDVGIEEVIDRADVVGILCPAFSELLRAEIFIRRR